MRGVIPPAAQPPVPLSGPPFPPAAEILGHCSQLGRCAGQALAGDMEPGQTGCASGSPRARRETDCVQMTPGLGLMLEGREPRDTWRGHKGQNAPLCLAERGSWKDGDLRTDKETSLQGRQEWHPRQREQPAQRGGVEKQEFNAVAGREGQTGLEARGRRAVVLCTGHELSVWICSFQVIPRVAGRLSPEQEQNGEAQTGQMERKTNPGGIQGKRNRTGNQLGGSGGPRGRGAA